MLHFIPSWYRQNGWSENEQYWHVRRQRTEFDDTVKQIQLFHRKKVYPYQITLLSFTPNFRHFLHRQGVYHAPYWSCFDAIQEVQRKKAMLLSFHNLKWPKGIEFIYTSFVVVAMLENERYAQVEFGEDGNPIQIDMYQDGEIRRRNIYDDRGFVSSTVLYQNGKPHYQDYLTEQGVWKLRCFQNDGHVEINPKQPFYLLSYRDKEKRCAFEKAIYRNLEEVLLEVFCAYVKLTDPEDLYCIAMHEQHRALLEKALDGQKVILSFYGDRYPVTQTENPKILERKANYIICDTSENVINLKTFYPKIGHITDITPYDTRQDSGISQQLKVQKILFPVDGIEEAVFRNAIRAFGQYLSENDNAEICLFTRKAEYNRPEELLGAVRHYLKAIELDERMAISGAYDQASRTLTENELEENDTVKPRFFVEQCVDELAVSKCMREQKVIVDLRRQADLYLQVNAVSFGIPQIGFQESNFMQHERNGMILKGMKELPDLLDFYLRGLANWNHASQEAYEISKAYSTDVLVRKWKEVIEAVERD